MEDGDVNKEDKIILGTLAGVDLVLSPEHYEEYKGTLNEQLEQKDKEIDRLNNIINKLEKYIHNELVLDFYNDDMPCELIINKMEKMIKELKENK
jgi:hypothetical protein